MALEIEETKPSCFVGCCAEGNHVPGGFQPRSLTHAYVLLLCGFIENCGQSAATMWMTSPVCCNRDFPGFSEVREMHDARRGILAVSPLRRPRSIRSGRGENQNRTGVLFFRAGRSLFFGFQERVFSFQREQRRARERTWHLPKTASTSRPCLLRPGDVITRLVKVIDARAAATARKLGHTIHTELNRADSGRTPIHPTRPNLLGSSREAGGRDSHDNLRWVDEPDQ